MSLTNVVNNAITDVLISTPITLDYALKRRKSYDPYGINPKFIIVDECDQLFLHSSDKVKKAVMQILRHFAGMSTEF